MNEDIPLEEIYAALCIEEVLERQKEIMANGDPATQKVLARAVYIKTMASWMLKFLDKTLSDQKKH